jgi:hypothetical protein
VFDGVKEGRGIFEGYISNRQGREEGWRIFEGYVGGGQGIEGVVG